MSRELHNYRLAHGPQTVLRLLLNDIPIYRVPFASEDQAISETCAAEHMLVKGRNTFGFELYQAPQRHWIKFSVEENLDWHAPVFLYQWPQIYREYPSVEEQPFLHQVEFDVPELDFRSAWQDAPTASFGPAGTNEQRRTVMRLYDALLRADSDAFMDEMSLKSNELAAAYPKDLNVDPDRVRGQFKKRFSQGLTVKPVSVDELVFESRAEGRVAYVYRRDGGQPIDAEAPNGEWMAHDLWLTYHQGDWRVFR